MAEGNALINFGDLSKPATVLVEKVCNAVGMIYEPTQMRRRARAEADAEKIKALARIELTDLEQRAMERLVHQESRKQENIESIAVEAASQLPENADVKNLDEDWVAHFFKQCDTVSDKEMQSLWSKLLSGEATNPGTFSKRTVNLISSIDKRDAELFTRFCQFVWMLGDAAPIIFDENNDVIKKNGISLSELKHLDTIGLISFEAMGGYARSGFLKRTVVYYFGMPMVIEFPAENNNKLSTGKVLFTNAGKQLFGICGSKNNEEYQISVLEKWVGEGLVVYSIFPQLQVN